MFVIRRDGWESPIARAADGLASGLSSVEPLSLRDAAGLMGRAPEPPPEEPAEKPEPEPVSDQPPPEDIGPADDEEPDEGDEPAAADDDQPPGDDIDETEDEADPADGDDLPPIEPPRSWTKAEKEAFAALPRAHQEALVERDRAREKDIRTRQDDAAARIKAAEAAEQAAQQARDNYAAWVDHMAAQSAGYLNSEFADIKTREDAIALRDNDPLRYMQWKDTVEDAQRYAAQQQQVQVQRQQEQSKQLQDYIQAETQKFLEAAPEFADPKRAPQLQAEVQAMLVEDYGISPQEMAEMQRGRPVSIHDHRFSLLVRDALEYRKAKSRVATKPKTPKPASPSPQKPGTKSVKGEVRNRTLDQADKELSRTGGREAALRLMAAKRSR